MFDIEQFPKRLREFRMLKGLSQKELAEMADLTPASLSAYEKESGVKGSKTPTLSTAVKMAEQLEVSIDWLCGRDESKKDTISNYRGVIETLLEIGQRIEYEVNFQTVGHYEEQKLCASVTFIDDNLTYFFQEWSKLKKLFDAGTIDRELCELWIEKQLGIYELMPLELLEKYKEIDWENNPPF
jgi:transcriptional regulator with XRE-family HTH domain